MVDDSYDDRLAEAETVGTQDPSQVALYGDGPGDDVVEEAGLVEEGADPAQVRPHIPGDGTPYPHLDERMEREEYSEALLSDTDDPTANLTNEEARQVRASALMAAATAWSGTKLQRGTRADRVLEDAARYEQFIFTGEG